jgi:hypothetical protein
MLTYGIAVIHDDARLHAVPRTRTLLNNFNWELFDYTPYRSDLAPSDYHLLICLKNRLGFRSFNNNELMEGYETLHF